MITRGAVDDHQPIREATRPPLMDRDLPVRAVDAAR